MRNNLYVTPNMNLGTRDTKARTKKATKSSFHFLIFRREGGIEAIGLVFGNPKFANAGSSIKHRYNPV